MMSKPEKLYKAFCELRGLTHQVPDWRYLHPMKQKYWMDTSRREKDLAELRGDKDE